MSKPQLRRPRVQRDLLIRFHKMVKDHPGSGRVELVNKLIAEDPRRSVFFYTERVGGTLTMDEMIKIMNAPSPEKAQAMKNEFLKNRNVEFKLSYDVISNLKQRVNNGEFGKTNPIYGAHGMGFRCQSDMGTDDAARWLRPRLRQLQYDEMSNRMASKILTDKASGSIQKGVANQIHDYITKGLHKVNLSQLADDIDKAFVKNIGKRDRAK